jgi:hypothetical protein
MYFISLGSVDIWEENVKSCMTDISFTDEQWIKIRDFLKQDPNACRRFVEAVK